MCRHGRRIFIRILPKSQKTAVWIRLEQLPIEYYHPEFLKYVGQKLGKLLKVDAITSVAIWGRYARICVQINIANPLPKRVEIGSFWQDIVYENLPMLCYKCGRIGHREPQFPETNTEQTSQLTHSLAPPHQTDPPLEPKQMATPWKTVHTRRMRGRTRPTDQHPRGKPPHPSSLSPGSPLGHSSTHLVAEPRMQKKGLASSYALDVPSETRQSQLGEVSKTYTKQLHEDPRERTKAGMLEPCMAECPSLPQRFCELAPIRVHALATPSSSQLYAHNKDVPSSHPTNTNQPSSPETHSTAFHLENGSILGPTLLDHNTNKSRPPPINHTPKQSSHGSPSHHEQPHSLSSNPCSSNGGTRTNLEQPVIGTFAKRDSKFCPDTGSPTNSNGVEPSVPIPESAPATRTASSTTNPTTTPL